MGIENDRFRVKDGGVRSYKVFKYTRSKKGEDIEKENRIITFRIVSTDYEPKKIK